MLFENRDGRAPLFSVFALTALTLHCGGNEPAAISAGHDAPIAASEPRAQLRVIVALTPRVGCDEAFELALYPHRGVELVTWAPTPSPLPVGSCRELRATVRYLPRQLSRADLVRRIQQLSLIVKVEEG